MTPEQMESVAYSIFAFALLITMYVSIRPVLGTDGHNLNWADSVLLTEISAAAIYIVWRMDHD